MRSLRSRPALADGEVTLVQIALVVESPGLDRQNATLV